MPDFQSDSAMVRHEESNDESQSIKRVGKI
jgi:hypothetical protein